MRTLLLNAALSVTVMAAACFGQQYPPPQQYPPAQTNPQQQQYPATQYPQQQQYPPQSYPQPVPVAPQQLDSLVGPIALYPDGLLAQVLTAATYSDQIPEAAGWANQHAYIHGDQLADAIRRDNLQFAPSVMALLPFPQVLSYMAQNMQWTTDLANAVLVQRPDVMDAVQRMRNQAYQYGYLRDPQYLQYERVNVIGPGMIEIVPVTPGFYFVPTYSPYVVYAAPRNRAFISGFFSFGGGIQIGAAFSPWGWGGVGFSWREHNILIDNRPWARTWVNRNQYVHDYRQPWRPVAGPRIEGHDYRHDQHRPPAHDEHHDGRHDR